MSLLQSIKRLAKHSAIYGIGHIINRSLGFILLPIYTNLFHGAAFGVVGVLTTWFMILSLVYVYGLDAGFLRFYIAADHDREKKRIFSTALISLTITSLMLSAIIWIWAPELSSIMFESNMPADLDLVQLLRILDVTLLFDTISFILLLVLRAEEKSLAFILFKISNVVVNVAANVFFLFILHQGVAGIFWANLVSSALTFVVALPLVFRYGNFLFSYSLLKKMFFFGLPVLPSAIAITLMDAVDRIFLERMTSLQSVGLYNSGCKLGMSMALFVAAFRFAWPPFFLSVAKQADAKLIYSRVLTYLIVACGFVFLCISIFIDPISQLSFGSYHLIGPEYWPANRIVPIILLAYVFYAFYLCFYVGPYLHDRTKYIVWSTMIGLLVNLAANWQLIPLLDYPGAAWARLLSYFAMAVSLYYFSQKLYPVSYEWQRLILLIPATAMLFIFGRTAWIQERIWLGLVLLMLYPLLLRVMGFFHSEELQKMRGFLPKVRI